MLVYFGKDGTLKEMVSSFTLSNGDTAYKNIQGSSVNYIYCYYEGRDPETINENSSHITFQKDGEAIVPSDIAPVAVGDWSIDFDRKQDLRYFEYEKPYRFVKFAVPNTVLATDGLASATSRLVIEGNIYSYGLITFNVSKSVVLKDSYITQSQYDYLVSIVAKGTSNAGDGLLKEDNVFKVDWTKVASKENLDSMGIVVNTNTANISKNTQKITKLTTDLENAEKVIPTDIEYHDGLTLMHDTTEITGQTKKIGLGLGLSFNATGNYIEVDKNLRDDVAQTKDILGEVYGKLDTHTKDTNNPHGVTKEQVGLGLVENKGIDATPTANSNNYVSSSGVKNYVDTAVGSISGFDYVVVDTLPTASAETMHRIYLVKDTHSDNQDNYDEYITIKTDSVYSWEKIGNTDIDLSQYLKKTDIVANGTEPGTDTLDTLKVNGVVYKTPEMPTNYVPNTRKVNNKALTADIILKGSDVGVSAVADTQGYLSKVTIDGTNYPVKPSVSESYTNATPTPIAVGGIAKGTTFENKSMSDMFNALLYPYVAPSNLVLNASEMNGVFESGTTVTLNSVSWSFNKNSGTPSRLVLKIAGETDIVIASGEVPTSGTYNLTKSIKGDTYARLVLTYEKGTINSNTVYATFVHPYYYGVGAVGTDPETLTKLVQSKGSKTLSFSPNKQHIIFAYPKSYGDLKSIKDSNGFENINGFTKTEGGSNVPYLIYTSNEASTNTNFKLTFSY